MSQLVCRAPGAWPPGDTRQQRSQQQNTYTKTSVLGMVKNTTQDHTLSFLNISLHWRVSLLEKLLWHLLYKRKKQKQEQKQSSLARKKENPCTKYHVDLLEINRVNRKKLIFRFSENQFVCILYYLIHWYVQINVENY